MIRHKSEVWIEGWLSSLGIMATPAHQLLTQVRWDGLEFRNTRDTRKDGRGIPVVVDPDNGKVAALPDLLVEGAEAGTYWAEIKYAERLNEPRPGSRRVVVLSSSQVWCYQQVERLTKCPVSIFYVVGSLGLVGSTRLSRVIEEGKLFAGDTGRFSFIPWSEFYKRSLDTILDAYQAFARSFSKHPHWCKRMQDHDNYPSGWTRKTGHEPLMPWSLE